MWLLRSLKFVFRLWLGSELVDRFLKSSQSNAESQSDTREGGAPGNGRHDGIGVRPIRLSPKQVVRIGLILLGTLVVLSLFVLVRVLWAIG